MNKKLLSRVQKENERLNGQYEKVWSEILAKLDDAIKDDKHISPEVALLSAMRLLNSVHFRLSNLYTVVYTVVYDLEREIKDLKSKQK